MCKWNKTECSGSHQVVEVINMFSERTPRFLGLDGDIQQIGKIGRGAGVLFWGAGKNSKFIYGHVEFDQWNYQRQYSCLEWKLESIISKVSSNSKILWYMYILIVLLFHLYRWMLIDVISYKILANNFQALVNCKIRTPHTSLFKKVVIQTSKLIKPTESDRFTKRFFTFTVQFPIDFH